MRSQDPISYRIVDEVHIYVEVNTAPNTRIFVVVYHAMGGHGNLGIYKTESAAVTAVKQAKVTSPLASYWIVETDLKD